MSHPNKILIIDDHPDLLAANERLLKKEGYETCTAASGREGMSQALAFHPDLILLDVALPDINGVEVCRQIRQMPECSNVFIILLSSVKTRSFDQADGFDAGADGYIARPISNRELVSRINTMMRIKRTETELRIQKEWLRVTLTSAGDGVITTDSQGRVTLMNPVAEEITGWSGDEAIGEPIEAIFSLQDKDFINPVRQVLENGSPIYLESYALLLAKDGRQVPIADSAAPIRGEDGQLQGVILLFQDVTEKYRIQEALRKSEEKFRTLFETMSEGVVYQDAEGNITSANPAAERILGLSLDQMQGKTSMDPRWKALDEHGNELPGEKHPAMIALRTGKKVENHIQGIFVPEREKYAWMIVNAIPQFKEGSDKPYQVYATFTDITERRQAEEALKESEDRFKKLSSFTFEGIVIHNNAIAIDANQSFVRMLGYEREEIIGMNLFKLIHPDDHEITKVNLSKQIATPYQIRVIRKDGSTFYAEVEARNISYNNEFFRVACVRDITERVRAQQKIEKLAKFPSENPYPILRVADNGHLIYANAASESLLENWGSQKGQLLPEKWREVIFAALESGQQKRSEARYNDRVLSLTFVPVAEMGYVNVYGLDITQRVEFEQKILQYQEQLEEMVVQRTQQLKVAQEKMFRQEKLATIGQLAGGIAHELRQPLSVISNAVYFLQTVLEDPSEKVAEYLALLDEETHNANHIIADLLEFARTGKVNPEAVAVPNLVTDILAKHPPPQAVTVKPHFPDHLPQAEVDPGHLRQALANLIENAYDAMTAGGRLSIFGEAYSENGDHSLRITVQDTGNGIPPKNLEKIFEPLFTTKARGIGLGLAVTKSLIEGNGGAIEVKSVEGEGSKFHVYLPLVRKT